MAGALLALRRSLEALDPDASLPRRLPQVLRQVSQLEPEGLAGEKLHALIDELQQGFADIHGQLERRYFRPSRSADPKRRQAPPKAGVRSTITVMISRRPSSMPRVSRTLAASGSVEKFPAGPIVFPSPGPTLATAVAAPESAVREVKPKGRKSEGDGAYGGHEEEGKARYGMKYFARVLDAVKAYREEPRGCTRRRADWQGPQSPAGGETLSCCRSEPEHAPMNRAKKNSMTAVCPQLL